MLGENLRERGIEAREVKLGANQEVGDALITIAQYGEPCYKFGHKFGTQKVLKQYIEHGFGGTYVSIL